MKILPTDVSQIRVGVSIESLDLGSLKKDILTVEIFSTVWKRTSRQSRFSRQFEKGHLSSWDFLNSLKNDIFDKVFAIKSWFLSLPQSRLSISTFQKPTSRLSRKSQQFSKVGLDTKDNLDLDLNWSQLSRPPGLVTKQNMFLRLPTVPKTLVWRTCCH